MAKRGRPRKSGKREPNGRIQREDAPPPVMLLQRRAEMVGEANVRDQKAGTAIGALYLRGSITKEQFEAAEEFARFWSRWKGMMAIPPRQIAVRERGAPGADRTVLEWIEARDRANGLVNQLRACEKGSMVWAAIDNVVLDDWMPGWSFASPKPGPETESVAALLRGLDVLAVFYGKAKKAA